ncbi:MAG TPA: SDR family oxidoreductase [Ramlibacter sp.]|nr:SDR family oxidoreductase [Ramlibacter sp.]
MPVNVQKVAVVTGGGGGIGAACAARLSRDGWNVVVCDIDAARAQAVAAAVGGVALALDISDAQAVEQAAVWVEEHVGPCHGLVACAAHLENPHPPQQQSDEEWKRILDVNVSGTFYTCRAFGARMAARGSGAIVTVASITALGSSPLVAYGPSKAAVVQMTLNLAGAWGRSGVRVNCVAPGPTRTPAVEASYARGERDPQAMIAQTALGRLVEPEQMAAPVAFLLSDDAAAITGVTLPVDAGVLVSGLWNLYGGIPPASPLTD